MTSQLALDLSFAPRLGADDYLVAPSNADAHALLTRWPEWPARVLLLVGPEGAGKSHLAAIWAAAAGARRLDAAELQPDRLGSITEAALLLEDADRLQVPEAALFHLLNRVRERQQFLLLTAQTAPDRWALATPDLLSRLRLAPLLHLHAPDDGLLRAVLVKLFVDRQLTVDSGVVEFLTLHLDRSLGAAGRLVDALDHASLASHRRITRPVAGEVLASLAA
jgi:chromosomal replication initiation ATPase DnaA